MKFISSVEQDHPHEWASVDEWDILHNRRNKFHIFNHPCTTFCLFQKHSHNKPNFFTANKVNKASGIENWYLLTYKITYFYTNEIFLRDPTCRRLTPVRIIDTVRSFNSHNMVIFYLQGLNAILFNKNVDAKTYISLVPTSAHTGDGMGDLIALIVKLCQTKLAQRLSYSEELQCTVLEVCLNSA